MELYAINWWLVLIGVVVSMINGSLWYNPKTLFNTWWDAVGGGKEAPGMENMGQVWGLTILSSAVKTVFIGVAVNAFAPLMGGFSLHAGLLTGFILWIGFIAPTYMVNKLFAGHGFKIWAIETGNHLVDFLIMGALFAVWP